MEDLNQEPVTGRKVKRPTLLSVLCILTFIGSGTNLFSSLLIFIFYPAFKTIAPEILKMFNITSGLETILNVKPVFFLVSAIIYMVALFGAYNMWNLKKRGFHFYTIAQIMIIILLMFFLKLPGPSIPDVIMSGIFITLYSINLKHMS